MKTEQTLIAEAYTALNEAKEAPFKEGDRVMTAKIVGGWSRHYSNPGKVVKTNKFGHMHVEYDHEPGVHRIFGSDGRARGDSSMYGQHLVPEQEGVEQNKRKEAANERRRDLKSVHDLIDGHRNDFGDYSKLDKETADKIHELIKKHTETPKE